MSIFADNAQNYWNAGLPAIPLIPGQKRPAINAWQLFSKTMPSEEQREAWLRHYSEGNIGLPMGAAANLVAIDIDTDEPELLQMLNEILPTTPWVRVGRKGYVRIYRYNGEKTTRIGAQGEKATPICEILSDGTQIVLPPSIHPDTKRPYTANSNLWEVCRTAPILPEGIDETIRARLREMGYEVSRKGTFEVASFVSAGHRDNAMVAHAGILARAVTRGERSLVDALNEMDEWINSYVQKVVGDELDASKGRTKVVEFLIHDVTGPRKRMLPEGWDDDLTPQQKKDMGIDFSDDAEEWPGVRILEYLAEQFTEHEEILGTGQSRAIEKTLARLASPSRVVTALDEARILKFIITSTSGALTVTDLRRRIKELQSEAAEGSNHEEISRAVHAHLNKTGEVRFHNGSFWRWKGDHWQVLEEHAVIKIVAEEFGDFPLCRKTNDYLQIVKLLKSTAAKELQQIKTSGVNFANGFLTEDLELKEADPDYGLTYVLPYSYLPELAGKMPLFNQFLVDSWGPDLDYNEKVDALQEIMGTTFFNAASKYHKAFCLFGQSRSGKSVCSSIMRELLPKESYSTVAPEDWGKTFLPVSMFGKIANFAGELDEHRKLPGRAFKEIVSGDPIQVQQKYEKAFTFQPSCAQWFNSNHIPKADDSSSGFTERWLFLEWTRQVDPARRIPELDKIIVAHEREAIAAWAIQGFVRRKNAKDYTYPASHHRIVAVMQLDNNLVRDFLTRSPLLSVGPSSKPKEISSHDLYNEFWSFSIAQGHSNRMTFSTFMKMMRALSSEFRFAIEDRERNGGQEAIFKDIGLVKK